MNETFLEGHIALQAVLVDVLEPFFEGAGGSLQSMKAIFPRTSGHCCTGQFRYMCQVQACSTAFAAFCHIALKQCHSACCRAVDLLVISPVTCQETSQCSVDSSCPAINRHHWQQIAVALFSSWRPEACHVTLYPSRIGHSNHKT